MKDCPLNISCDVLIETYWNVNLFEGYSYTDIGSSINRNILECKYIYCH